MSDPKFYEYSATKNPKYLVIFLHGYGSNGKNLIDLAVEFKKVLPEAHFISPNAIEPWEGGFPDSYQWFSIGAQITTLISEKIKKANEILSGFIKKKLTEFNLKYENLVLIGFSQGAMMAIYQSFITEEKMAAVVSFSGRVLLAEEFFDKKLAKTSICLIHGKQDSVVSFSNFLEAEKNLTKLQISHESHAFEKLDHTIDIRGIKAAQAFITKQISK
ncbi:MAG: dienelactone hydrolase family protein [Rickettsiales bacterium]|nr:dienelactone hydrolase family protein [Rickettsiales bacterium]